MNDTSIKPINSVQQTESSALTKSLSQTQADVSAQQQVRLSGKKQVEHQKESSMAAGSLANISIHFRVDDKTNDVTVFLVDRKTKKVLRSIPADELQKLQIGDLLKLTI